MPAQIDRALLAIRPTKALERLVAYALFEGRPVTTRGRWINPLVFALGRLSTSLPLELPSPRPIFVLGTGRSGTTWLGRTLGLHPRLSFLNEPKALWHLATPDQDVIGSYSDRPGRLTLGADDASPVSARRAQRLYGAFARLTRGQRVLDKYPEMLFRVPFLRAIFPAASFVIVLRNGWSTARSVERWSARHGREVDGKRHDWWGVDDRKWRSLVNERVPEEADLAPALAALLALREQRERAALEWTLSLRVAQRLEGQPGVHLVRLEDLSQDLEPTLARLFEACELESDAGVLAYARRTVEPSIPVEPFALAAPLDAAFARTSAELGYP